ncbi:MAG: glycerophosphodiester phosphodiesterase [Hyphomicrobiales bacterium]
MPISFHAADNGFTHVCAHRGYSLRYPENTLVAFEAAKAAGATTCEIDLVLTRDGEAVVMHDALLDRTTDGYGFVADHDLADIRARDAAMRFKGRFSGIPVPTFAETVLWAKRAGMGLVVEMKERERPDALSSRVLDVLEETDGIGQVLVLSFNHVDLARIKEKAPELRTEAIVHARHVDIVAVLKACGASSVSFELDMFALEDAKAVHAAGLSNRVHIPRPEALAPYWICGRDPRAQIGAWLSAGLIDSLSGDDVAFLRKLVDQNPIRSPEARSPQAAA